jgi:hypothetical protein
MTTTTNNKPLQTLRDGAIKASIWQNASEKGAFYSVEFSRTYKSGEVFKDSGSFSGSDLLKICRLAEAAYAFIVNQRQLEAVGAKQSASIDGGAA